jgi:hypothetical protein
MEELLQATEKGPHKVQAKIERKRAPFTRCGELDGRTLLAPRYSDKVVLNDGIEDRAGASADAGYAHDDLIFGAISVLIGGVDAEHVLDGLLALLGA